MTWALDTGKWTLDTRARSLLVLRLFVVVVVCRGHLACVCYIIIMDEDDEAETLEALLLTVTVLSALPPGLDPDPDADPDPKLRDQLRLFGDCIAGL
jgi:hypothetical protein